MREMPIESLGTFEKAAQRSEMINRVSRCLKEVRAAGSLSSCCALLVQHQA